MGFPAWLLAAWCVWGLWLPSQMLAQPVNNDFTNATPIFGAVGTINGTTINATVEPGEPNHYPFTVGGHSVWYAWTAPADGLSAFDTSGSAFDTTMAVYVGTNVANLSLIGYDDDSGIGLASRVVFQAVAGTVYRVAVDGYASASGGFRLSWTAPTNTVPVVANAFQFGSATFSAYENTPGFAVVSVTYGGGALGNVSVDYSTADGTALAGTDYFSTSNTLTFAPGQTNLTFTVPIQDDALQNGNRTVLLSLANPTGGAQLGAISNAVLTILDDETLPIISTAGVFNFSMPVYVVTENETIPAPFPGPSINVPNRNALGALVMVTRTGGSSGRVLVDVAVGAAFPFTQTLMFDDYQMSATFLVPIPQAGAGIINLTLLNPRPDPLEDPVIIVPTIGVAQSSIQILAVDAAAPVSFSIERKTHRMDEYNPFDPFNFSGFGALTNFIDIDVINPSGTAGSVGIETRANLYGYFILDGSDYPDASNFIFPETPYTDGFAGITNYIDYTRFDVRLTFGQGVTRLTVRLVVTNDTTVEFNEDVQLRLHDPAPPRALLNPLANVTIMYDDQPSGQADREWDPEFISSTQPPFNNTPGANNTVSAVAVQPDNRTVLVGDFTAVNSVSRFRVARMNPDGSLDQTFNPGSGADGNVEAVLIYPTVSATTTNAGKILVAGGFSAFNNVSRHGVARLNANGSLDNSFFVGNGADGVVHSITFQSDAKVIVAGEFTHWNDVPAPGLMRLNQDGSLDTTFNPGLGPDNTIWAVAVRDVAGMIFVPRDAAGTDFEDVNVIETGSGQGTITIDYDFLTIPDNIRVFYEGVLLTNFTGNSTGRISVAYGPGTATDFTIILNQGTGLPGTLWFYRASVLPVVANRTIYVGGDFTSFNSTTRNGVARLLDNGSLDVTFDPGLGVDNTVFALAVQPDGKLLAGGAFTRFHTHDRNSMVRILSSGLLDENYNTGTGFNDSVYTILLEPDNKALVGGVFQNYNGTRRMGMARLFVGGSLDTSFMDTAYNQFAGLTKTHSFDPPRYVKSIARQADGKLMIGGSFTNLGGNFSISHFLRNNYTVFTRADKTTRFNIARLIGGYTPGPGNLEYDPAALPFTIDENAGAFYATMRRVDGRLGTALIIATNEDNTALAPFDYTAEALAQRWPEFAFAAPRSVGFTGLNYFSVPITEDILQEGDETFRVGAVIPDGSITLGGEFIPLGTALGHLDRVIVAIADNDFSHGEFNFNTTVYMTNENAGFAVITVVRTNGSSGSASVDYLTRPGLTSPATTNADFTPVRGTLSFASGQTTRTFNVPIFNDAFVEFDENVALILTNATGGAKLPGGTPTSIARATLVIIDNDFLQGRLNFSADNFTNNENDVLATVTVTRTGGNVGAMTVQVRTGNGTATAPADFTGVTNTLSWADGDSSTKSFTIPLVADGIVEGSETVNLFLFNPLINGALGARTNATLVIEDADHFGALSFSQPLYEADENGPSPTIVVNRSGGIAGTVSVTYATSPLTAVPGLDYNDVTGTLTFLPGETSKTFVVPILDDTVPDGDKDVRIDLVNPVNASLGAVNSVTLMLIDNESLNIPAGSLDTTFSSTAQTDEAVYALALQTDGRILMAGDFNLVNNVPRHRIARLKAFGALDSTFDTGPGANDSIRALALQNDGKIILGGLFTVFNSTNRNRIARLATDGSLDAFFNPGAGADNPIFALAIQGDDKILAGGSFATFNGLVRPGIVRLNTNGAVDVAFNTGAGVNGTIYAIALQSDGKVLVGGEFVSFNGVARTNLVRLNANGTLDNSFNPALSIDGTVRALFVQPDGRLVLGGSFTNVNGVARYRLARLGATGLLDPVFLSGVAGADGTVNGIQSQIDGKLIVVGEFRRFNGVTRNGITRLRTDGTTDPAINFGNGANAFVAAAVVQPDRRIVIGGGFTVYDDLPRAHVARIYGGSIEGSGSLEYSAPEFTVGESSGFGLVSVRRRGGTMGEVRVDAFTLNNTALAGVDYLGVSNTLVFPEGETSSGLNIPILPNGLPQNDRTVDLRLANFSPNAAPGPQPVSVLIIRDDDPVIGFSAGNYAVNENAVSGNATITVLRAGATNATLTVNIGTVAGGNATAGSDYIATNALLTFGPGELSKLFNVHVINDTNIEGNESIFLSLFNPGPGTALGISGAVLNLVDDDSANGAFYFSTNNYVVNESSGTVLVTILRTNGSSGIVSVRLTTSNLTASAFSDYTPTNRVITFNDGVTNISFAISILNDSVAEPDEAFLLTLSQPTGGAIILTTNSLVTIVDDEILPSNLGFSTNQYFVFENAGQASISVVRTNSRRGYATVDYTVGSGSATAGLDFIPTNGTLVFLDGQDTQNIIVPIINDSLVEGHETVNLSLFNPGGVGVLGAPTAVTLSIVDDDTGIIVAAGAGLFSESLVPTNNIIDPGETVSVLFALRNSGTVNATNVTASIIYGNGVNHTNAQTQNYGTLIAGGSSVSRPFIFTASGTNGAHIVVTLAITNNGVFLGRVTYEFVLGSLIVPFQSTNLITINDHTTASPYPATLTVAGVSGPINKLTVTLHGLTHSYPADLDILLVGPNGTAVMLMSDAGTNVAVNGITVTFDDAAGSAIPQFSGLTNGSYRCANYSPFTDTIPPYPAGTGFWTNTPTLAAFRGTDANGVWSLYVNDDNSPDAGFIAGGWSLVIGTATPVTPGADLLVAVTDAPDPAGLGATITYRIGVTNYGLATATSVALTNVLPAGAGFVSVSGPGTYSLNAGVLVGSLGTLLLGEGTTVTVTMTAPNTAGQLTFDTTVGSATLDLNTANNHATATTTVAGPAPIPALLARHQNGQLVLSWGSTATNLVLQSSSAISVGAWSAVAAVPARGSGVSSVTLPMDAGSKFYRLKQVP